MYLGSLGMSLTPPGCPEGYIQTVHADEEDILFFFLNKALDFFFFLSWESMTFLHSFQSSLKQYLKFSFITF